MLRRTSGLSRPVLRWASQVLASLGATLSATLIWSAVPHPGGAPAAQALVSPELTSGGKFAARAVQPAVYDGLDTMPLPRVAPAPARFVLASLDAAPPRMSRRAAGDEASAAAAVATPVAATVFERRIARPARAPLHAELRRAEPAPSAVPAAQPATQSAVAPAVVVLEAAPEVGLLHRMLPAALPSSLTSLMPSIVPSIASTAREAWSVTASAGDALVEHVVPRMP